MSRIKRNFVNAEDVMLLATCLSGEPGPVGPPGISITTISNTAFKAISNVHVSDYFKVPSQQELPGHQDLKDRRGRKGMQVGMTSF